MIADRRSAISWRSEIAPKAHYARPESPDSRSRLAPASCLTSTSLARPAACQRLGRSKRDHRANRPVTCGPAAVPLGLRHVLSNHAVGRYTGAIYTRRGSRCGNPFRIGVDCDRAAVSPSTPAGCVISITCLMSFAARICCAFARRRHARRSGQFRNPRCTGSSESCSGRRIRSLCSKMAGAIARRQKQAPAQSSYCRSALDSDRLIGQPLDAFYEEVRVLRINLVDPGGQADDAAGCGLFQSSLELVERGCLYGYRRSLEHA